MREGSSTPVTAEAQRHQFHGPSHSNPNHKPGPGFFASMPNASTADPPRCYLWAAGKLFVGSYQEHNDQATVFAPIKDSDACSAKWIY